MPYRIKADTLPHQSKSVSNQLLSVCVGAD